METTSTDLSNTAELASWNMPRSISQLRSFVSAREEAIDVEDFDF